MKNILLKHNSFLANLFFILIYITVSGVYITEAKSGGNMGQDHTER